MITPCSEAQPLPPQIYNQRYTRPGHPNPPRPNFAPMISRMFRSLRSNGQGRISPPPWVKMTRGTRTRAANSTPPSAQDSHYSHFWETWWLYKQKHKILRFVYNANLGFWCRRLTGQGRSALSVQGNPGRIYQSASSPTKTSLRRSLRRDDSALINIVGLYI